MTIPFWKYHGAANDFILVDQRIREHIAPTDQPLIEALCDRRRGIGADGLITLHPADEADFHMVYFNADGRPGSMCGNGGRCIAAFARHLDIVQGDQCRFTASDGPHRAHFTDTGKPGLEWVDLEMKNVDTLLRNHTDWVLDTGSPHYVRFLENGLHSLDVFREGRTLRNSDPFLEKGINVNFVQIQPDGSLHVRTYERGVEDETWACGTGVTASVLAFARMTGLPEGQVPVTTRGGRLSVRFQTGANGGFTGIWLSGEAQRAFEGAVDTRDLHL